MDDLIGFMPLILLIALLVWWYRRSKRKQEAIGIKSVGGWLALLTVSLIALRPLFLLGEWSELSYLEWKHDPMVSLAGWETYKLSLGLLNLLVAGLSVYAGVGLWSGRTWGMVKRAIATLWLIGPIYALLQAAALYVISSGQAEAKNLAAMLTQNILVASIWTAYLLKSRQVKELYRRGVIAQVERPTRQLKVQTPPSEKRIVGSRFNMMLDSPFKRLSALISGVGLIMLMIGWLQIVARYWTTSVCIQVMIDHVLFHDTTYMLFTYGFYLSLFGLMGSAFYDQSIGRIVGWVRTGRTSQS